MKRISNLKQERVANYLLKLVHLLSLFAIGSFSYENIFQPNTIATTSCSTATAGHNQRKIARDSKQNLHVFYQDKVEGVSAIKVVRFNSNSATWNSSEHVCFGKSPATAISRNDQIYLVYVSNDSLSKIVVKKIDTISNPEIVLSESHTSNTSPVADIDKNGKLHVIWLSKTETGGYVLKYRCIGDTISQLTTLSTIEENVTDAVIANHLLYKDNDVYVTYSYTTINNDSLFAMKVLWEDSTDWKNFGMYTSRDSYPQKGKHPVLAIGFPLDHNGEPTPYNNDSVATPVLLYLDEQGDLISKIYENFFPALIRERNIFYNTGRHEMSGPLSNVLIDNPVYPIGFSYIFLKNSVLYHNYGNFTDRTIERNTIDNNPLHPTMTYKHFNYDFIDVCWMQKRGVDYDITYQRMAKRENVFTQSNKKTTLKINLIRKNKIILLVNNSKYHIIKGNRGIKLFTLHGKFIGTIDINEKGYLTIPNHISQNNLYATE